MLREAEILEWAAIYRDMARRTVAPELAAEFADRAARYELVALAVERGLSMLQDGSAGRPIYSRVTKVGRFTVIDGDK